MTVYHQSVPGWDPAPVTLWEDVVAIYRDDAEAAQRVHDSLVNGQLPVTHRQFRELHDLAARQFIKDALKTESVFSPKYRPFPDVAVVLVGDGLTVDLGHNKVAYSTGEKIYVFENLDTDEKLDIDIGAS